MIKVDYPERLNWPAVLKRPVFDTETLENTVNAILLDVKNNGNTALIKYTELFDKVKTVAFEVTEDEFRWAENNCAEDLKSAIQIAKGNIEKFHAAQKETIQFIETTEGVTCWRKSVAIEKVGLYIPGGSAPLFSTLLMLGIPAILAGCKEIIVCTPPSDSFGNGSNGGTIAPAILYTAKLLGIRKVYKLGGVQAIGAMAYGTQTIPKVYKIFGPGNQYVTCAKQVVNKEGTAIDMPAGPSELAVVVDESCVPSFVAADLLSQAEHGPDSQLILVATNNELIDTIRTEIQHQLSTLPRMSIAEKALQNSKAILVRNMDEAIDLLNEYAAEHLIIACENDTAIAERIINAGSVFLGNYSPESAGDYASGTNHTLPTNGYSKNYSGVSLDSFIKKITFQKITSKGIKNIGPAIETMALAEGLYAHKNAVSIRLESKNIYN